MRVDNTVYWWQLEILQFIWKLFLPSAKISAHRMTLNLQRVCLCHSSKVRPLSLRMRESNQLSTKSKTEKKNRRSRKQRHYFKKKGLKIPGLVGLTEIRKLKVTKLHLILEQNVHTRRVALSTYF